MKSALAFLSRCALVATTSLACGSSSTGAVADGGGGPQDGASGAATLSNLPPKQWTWVPVAGALCRDGSATGIGASVNPQSNKLMIFLQGGGACFNAATCAKNPSAYGPSHFARGFGPSGIGPTLGVFNRADRSNPVADWSMIFVPYCTGDVHAGQNANGSVPGVGPQSFVGYANVGLYLRQILPTFSNVDEVLLTGVSAGGYGALMNYDQVQAAFGSVPVEMLDDSGPLMSTTYIPACLQTEWATLWNLDATILADCGVDCPKRGDYLLPYLKHVVTTHPNRSFGLLDADEDSVIRWFYGFGLQSCQDTSGDLLAAATYKEGLLDTRAALSSAANFGLYTWDASQHTTIENATPPTAGEENLDTLDAGVPLTSWLANLIDGGVSNVGP